MSPPDDRRRTATNPLGVSAEAAALWRTVESNEKRADSRFESIEESVTTIKDDVSTIKDDVKGILATDERRVTSIEKRNQRLWQVGGPVMAGLVIALIIALFKVFAPIAVTGLRNRPDTVNEMVDHASEEH